MPYASMSEVFGLWYRVENGSLKEKGVEGKVMVKRVKIINTVMQFYIEGLP